MESSRNRLESGSRVHTLGPKNILNKSSRTPCQSYKIKTGAQTYSINKVFVSGGCTSIFGPVKTTDCCPSISLSQNNAALVISELSQLKNKYTQLQTQLAQTSCIEEQMLRNVVHQTKQFQNKINNIVVQSEVEIGNKQNLEKKLISQEEKQEKKRQIREQKQRERQEKLILRAQRKERQRLEYELKRKQVIEALEKSTQRIEELECSNALLMNEMNKSEKSEKQLDVSIQTLKAKILKIQTQNELVVRTIREQVNNFANITKN